ncbi:MAG TPA: ribosome maturation factor RimM, partial [Brevibacterium sp.]|nr:ribosome maturation factor RimM [Brevibacterium sp.]
RTMSQVAARLGKPHGIRGEVTIEIRTDDPDSRFVPGARFATDPDIGALTLERARWHRDRLLLTFAEVADRSRAEQIRDTEILIDGTGDAVEDDAWRVEELVDLAVELEDGTPVGTVTDLTVGAMQDLLHVRTTAGEEVLVPFVEEIVPEVDPEERRMVLTPPPGLIDDGDAEADGTEADEAGADEAGADEAAEDAER